MGYITDMFGNPVPGYSTSNNAAKTNAKFSGVSGLGWIVAVVIVLVLYDKFPAMRGFLVGMLGVITLGIALRYQSNVTGAFHQLFFTKG